jgi:hypothetical protein
MSENTYDKECDAGYYCGVGSTIPNPVGDPENIGDICQPGFYCPAGSSEPIECEAGTYEPREGSSSC